ncbi:lysophospholipase, putative, partial [Plasmodium chabaudi chabaudi]
GESQAWNNIRGSANRFDDLVDDVIDYMNYIQDQVSNENQTNDNILNNNQIQDEISNNNQIQDEISNNNQIQDEISNNNQTNDEPYDIVTTKKKRLPIYIIGHSMGGSIAIRILQLLRKEKEDDNNSGDEYDYKKCNIMLDNSTNATEINNSMVEDMINDMRDMDNLSDNSVKLISDKHCITDYENDDPGTSSASTSANMRGSTSASTSVNVGASTSASTGVNVGASTSASTGVNVGASTSASTSVNVGASTSANAGARPKIVKSKSNVVNANNNPKDSTSGSKTDSINNDSKGSTSEREHAKKYNLLDELNIRGCISLSGMLGLKIVGQPESFIFKYIYLPVTKLMSHLAPYRKTIAEFPYKTSQFIENVFKYDKLRYNEGITYKYLHELIKTMGQLFENAKNMPKDIPLLLIHSKDDGICNYKGSQSFHDKIDVPGKEIYLVENLNHSTTLESGNEDVLRKVLDWINSKNEDTNEAKKEEKIRKKKEKEEAKKAKEEAKEEAKKEKEEAKKEKEEAKKAKEEEEKKAKEDAKKAKEEAKKAKEEDAKKAKEEEKKAKEDAKKAKEEAKKAKEEEEKRAKEAPKKAKYKSR